MSETLQSEDNFELKEKISLGEIIEKLKPVVADKKMDYDYNILGLTELSELLDKMAKKIEENEMIEEEKIKIHNYLDDISCKLSELAESSHIRQNPLKKELTEEELESQLLFKKSLTLSNKAHRISNEIRKKMEHNYNKEEISIEFPKDTRKKI